MVLPRPSAKPHQLLAAPQEAWSHLARDRACSLAAIDGGAVPGPVARALGLARRAAPAPGAHARGGGGPVLRAGGAAGAARGRAGLLPGGEEAAGQCCEAAEDAVVFGTGAGEVVVVVASAEQAGRVVLRLPVFRSVGLGWGVEGGRQVGQRHAAR